MKKVWLGILMAIICLMPALAGCSISKEEKSTPQSIALSANNDHSTPKPDETRNTLPVQSVPQDQETSSEKPAVQPSIKDTAGSNNSGQQYSGRQHSDKPSGDNTVPQPASSTDGASQKQKIVYLTFDDGPNTDFTPQILEILNREQVKASFMVVGKNAAINSELVKQIIDQGHALINHSYSHDYKKLYASPDNFVADLDKNKELLKTLTGKEINIFRAPGGPAHLTKPYWEKLREKGYISISWNITGGDSDPARVTPEQIYNSVSSGLAKVEGAHLTPIVLLHDGTQLSTTSAKPDSPQDHYIKSRESDVASLPDIINLFKDKGYTFAQVDENTPPAW